MRTERLAIAVLAFALPACAQLGVNAGGATSAAGQVRRAPGREAGRSVLFLLLPEQPAEHAPDPLVLCLPLLLSSLLICELSRQACYIRQKSRIAGRALDEKWKSIGAAATASKH